MIGSPATAKTIERQLGMPVPAFLHGDNPQTMLDWPLTFVRHGGTESYGGSTNEWTGNEIGWTETSNMESFAMPLNLQQVADGLTPLK